MDGPNVQQYDETHRAVRTIVFSWYSWDTEYTFTGHGVVVGGDNLKGLAEGQLLYSKDWIVHVEHKRPLVKHRLNWHVSNAYCYEIEGKDKDGEFARLRDFFFKGRHSMHTFEVFYFEEAGKEKLDPESKFVLDSIEEVNKRR